jgi:nucleoside-diphosphate-sugar epimerase
LTSKVLITGGGGYIGAILVSVLLEREFPVHVIDDFRYGENSLALSFNDPKLRVSVGDVRDAALMRDAVKSADVVIPLAAIVGAPACARDPVTARTINVDATLSLFNLLSDDQIVLMPTTNSAYGQGQTDNYCDESSPLMPLSQYAKEKVEIEKRLLELPNAVSFRLATVFGMSSRMRLDLLVNDFVNRALRDRYLVVFEGHFRRNYIHVRDVADLFIFALSHIDQMKGNIFNAGLSDANVSKLELCQLIQAQLPDFYFVEAPLKKDPDQRNYLVSNEKLAKAGFSAKRGLSEGIAELVKGIPTLKTRVFANA